MKHRFLFTAIATVAALFAPVAQAATSHVRVTAGTPSEFRFTLSTSHARRGTVVFTINDRGTVAHDFEIAGKKSKLIQPGKTTILTVSLAKPGRYPYKCTVPGHARRG